MCGGTSFAACRVANRTASVDLNAELRCWVAEVANRRVHGTTHEQVLLRLDEDLFSMQPIERPPALSIYG